MAADTCRLCLGPVDIGKCTDLVTETTKLAMLKDILPEVNLDISENTQVCTTCVEQLETSYNFKHGVVVNEAKIQTKLEENKLKKIDLKLMLGDVAAKDLKKSDYICRTCLSICRTPNIRLFNSPSNMMPYSFVKKMCEVVFELEFIASVKPVLCDDCWETLQTVYNFRKSCLRTDKRLRIYVASNNVTKLSIDEFKKFTEENPVKEEDEDSSDEELDGCIKDEPLDNDDELKLDPDEASCSSSSVKVKEETEIKSESELNSDDEDMEDEPELLDPKAVKSETNDVDGEDCKMEIGDVKVDAEGEDTAGPSGNSLKKTQKPLLDIPVQAPLFLCTECAYTTMRKEHLRKHLLTHASPDKITMFECTECSYKCKRKDNLALHKVRHATPDQIAMYHCTECSYKTKRLNCIRRHKIMMHTPRETLPTYYCSECEFSTKRELALIQHKHLHAAPGTIPIYNCTECSYKSIRKGGLTRHLLIHAPPKTVPMFQCTDCDYASSRKETLNRHRLAHAPPGTAPVFSCTKCPYTSIWKEAVVKHELTHDPATYRCAECPYQAKRKDSLIRHVVSHRATK